jgi:hypothetical protein
MQQNLENPLLTEQMEDCIQDCLNAHTACQDTFADALQKSMSAEYIVVLLDCSEICLAAAHSMLRNSALCGYFCQICATISNHCAEMSFQLGMNDCGNACNASSHSCEQIIKMIP